MTFCIWPNLSAVYNWMWVNSFVLWTKALRYGRRELYHSLLLHVNHLHASTQNMKFITLRSNPKPYYCVSLLPLFSLSTVLLVLSSKFNFSPSLLLSHMSNHCYFFFTYLQPPNCSPCFYSCLSTVYSPHTSQRELLKLNQIMSPIA